MRGALVPPIDYRETWGPEKDPEVRNLMLNAMAQAAATRQEMPDDADPRSLEAIRLECFLRQLVISFDAYTPPPASHSLTPRDKGEILVCALTNVLGMVSMSEVRSIEEVTARLHAICTRLTLFGDDVLRAQAAR